MTYALIALAVVLAALVGYRLWKSRQPVPYAEARQRLGLVGVALDPVALADQPADVPWSVLAAPVTSRGAATPAADTRGAGDWYDPTVETIPQTFNEFGFITSPTPAPVDPNTGRVPLTNADVCAWAGHAPGNPCPRCGITLGP